jgi:type II secretory pathway pseudopilin PulG
MGRVALVVIVVLAVVFAVAGPSSASQCPKLIQKVNDEAGNRLDDAAYNARQLAAQAEELHKAGKHAESEAKAKEAMKQLGIQ